MALCRAKLTVVFFVLFGFGFAGCGSNKPVNSDETSEVNPEDTTFISEPEDVKEPIITQEEVIETVPSRTHSQTKGIIKDYSLKGCGFLIEVEVLGRKTLFKPDILDSKFMKDGTVVIFSFTKTRQPATCEGAIPIIIDSME